MKKKSEKKEWWKKPPRSSRICYRCKHKYSSHIDTKCNKIIERSPRIECDCKGFVATKKDLPTAIKWEEALQRRVEVLRKPKKLSLISRVKTRHLVLDTSFNTYKKRK